MALTVLICSNANRLGFVTGLLDRPDGVRKLHHAKTPLIGGIAALAPSFAVSAFYIYQSRYVTTPFLPIVIGAAAVALLVGVLDDRVGLRPFSRLIALLCVVIAVFFMEPLFILNALRFGYEGFGFAIPLGIFAAPLTALMILGFVNAANMADGMNGQLLGSLIFWSLLLAYYLGFEAGIPFLVFACSALVAFVFNMRGQLFSGSGGAYGASLFIALGAIAAYRISNATLPAEQPLFWFWLPVTDCLRLVVSRVRSGRQPVLGDRQHIHHFLQEDLRAPYPLMVYLALLSAPGVASIVDERLGGLAMLLCLSCYMGLLFRRARQEREKLVDGNTQPY